LIVDDDKTTRLLASAALQGAGFLVEDAECGTGAIAAFERFRPDIVLLDVLMEDMDGFAVCAALRGMVGGGGTPIMMMTVLDDVESINRAYEVGATDFVTKPFNCVILGHRARYMLRTIRAGNKEKDRESDSRGFRGSDVNLALRAIVQASPLVIVVHDTDGNVRMWNHAAERIFGWKEIETAGRPDPTVQECDEEENRTLRRRVLEGETLTGVEARRRSREGSAVDIRFSAVPLHRECGDTQGVMYVIENITERRIAEEERRKLKKQIFQAAKMEAVGRLAAGVSHDFNNIVTAIDGYSDLLLGQLDEADPRRRNVEEIRKAGERAGALTRQLLSFSRQQAPQLKVLDLNGLILNLESMLRRLIGEDIEIRTHLDTGLWPVKTDLGQIEQVIINLAVNARDAMPRGGKLSIETCNVRLDDVRIFENIPVRPGCYAMLVVSDNGSGMDGETRRHIFDPFFTTKEADKGTGLGLSVVYGIVKNSGGYVWVYSEPGRGTTFKIYLPRVEEKPESAAPAVAAFGGFRGSETVLLVEDDDAVRKLLREVLERIGYTVLDACNGGEALGICERSEGGIHLTVTDIVMPEMSGVELSRRIRSLQPGMKTLYMSGYSDNSLAYHGIMDTGTSFLQKPFTPEALGRKVREVLDG
jgi:PAS domain S-box-containing protein